MVVGFTTTKAICKTELSRQMLDINLSVASSMSPRIQQYFSYIVIVRFIGGGNHSALRKPLTNIIT
jgi:hypothetical protein